ncbi:hypothetical protein ABG067_004133 [Albugo candida]
MARRSHSPRSAAHRALKVALNTTDLRLAGTAQNRVHPAAIANVVISLRLSHDLVSEIDHHVAVRMIDTETKQHDLKVFLLEI